MGQKCGKKAENLIFSMLNTNIRFFTFACLDNRNSVKKDAGPPGQKPSHFFPKNTKLRESTRKICNSSSG
jgi:hypothetical protein